MPLGSLTLPRCVADLTLRLVIKRQPEGIPKGHQRPLHGVGLRLLEGRLMGLPQIHVDAVAGTTAFTDQGRQPTSGDGDADAGGVGDAPTGLLISADGSFGLGDTADGNRLPLPAIEAKDAVRLGHGKPPLDIRDLAAALLPLADVGPLEWGREGSELVGGEARGLNRDGGRRGFGRGWKERLGAVS